MNTEYNNNNQMNMQYNEQQVQSQPVYNQPMYNESSQKNNGSKNNKILLIGAAIVLVTVIGVVGFFLLKGKSGSGDDMFASGTSFFLSNEDGNYALFNEDGKQLTDFIFVDADYKEFINHATDVEDINGNQGVIRDNGKYVVELSDNTIGSYGPFFKIYGEETKYIDSNGKTVLSGNEWNSDVNHSNRVFLFYNDTELKLIHFNGTVLDTIEVVDSEKSPGLLSSLSSRIEEYDDEYATFYYNDKVYVYDIKNVKKVAEYDGKINYLRYDKEESPLAVVELEDRNIVLKDGKSVFTFTNEQYNIKRCSLVGDYIIFENDGSYNQYTIVDSSGEIVTENAYTYIDGKNYVIRERDTASSNTYKFYADGKLVNTLEFEYNLDEVGGLYRAKVKTTEEYGYSQTGKYYYGYTYYNAKGEKANENPYYSAGEFQKDGYAVVRTNTSQKEYYLADKELNKVSDVYENIKREYTTDDGKTYYVAEKDSVNYLLSGKGEVLGSGFNTVGRYNGDNYYITLKYDDSTHVYSSITGKKLVELRGTSVVLEEHYAYTVEDGVKTYYSYTTGKTFYSAKIA